jgi:hypothetical protein
MSQEKINYRAYSVVLAINKLGILENRLSSGMHVTKSIPLAYSAGASVDALCEARDSLTNAYASALELIENTKQYLYSAQSQFEEADNMAARFLFALGGFGQVSIKGSGKNG